MTKDVKLDLPRGDWRKLRKLIRSAAIAHAVAPSDSGKIADATIRELGYLEGVEK